MSMSNTVRIRVRDAMFDCESCANTIEHVLEATYGVEQIDVDESTERVEIDYDPDIVAPTELEMTFEAWGYTPRP
ncbi:cation transporter [Natronobacterium texcoconense]|nr:heavy metal-associated domain-containing protein [Natronobacterium texcoconense]